MSGRVARHGEEVSVTCCALAGESANLAKCGFSGVVHQRKDRYSSQKTLRCTSAQQGAEGRGVSASKEGADLKYAQHCNWVGCAKLYCKIYSRIQGSPE